MGFCHTGTLTLWLAYRLLPTVHIVTRWSGSGGTEVEVCGYTRTRGYGSGRVVALRVRVYPVLPVNHTITNIVRCYRLVKV